MELREQGIVVEIGGGQKKSPIGGSKQGSCQRRGQRAGWRDPSLKTGQNQG
jgi:hypothetical protein